jgi:hypothetical protein
MRWLICIPMLFVFTVGRAEPAKISQDTFSGRTYYHLMFTLTATNSSFIAPSAYTNLDNRIDQVSTFDVNGFFEIFIKASDFPVPSSGCNGGWIILRMTGTWDDDPYADEKVEAKRELWKRLQKMYASGTDSVDVAIQLNPYVHVIDPSGPKLELDYCNIFFRQAYGEYIPYVGALKSTNNFPVEKLPTTWPATDDIGSPQGTNSFQMLHHWFNKASKKSLGTEADTTAIRKVILDTMTAYNNPQVDEIHWLSPTLIIAAAHWYTGPEGAGAFYYVLEKNGSDWKIINHYLIGVS